MGRSKGTGALMDDEKRAPVIRLISPDLPGEKTIAERLAQFQGFSWASQNIRNERRVLDTTIVWELDSFL